MCDADESNSFPRVFISATPYRFVFVFFLFFFVEESIDAMVGFRSLQQQREVFSGFFSVKGFLRVLDGKSVSGTLLGSKIG